YIGNEIGLQAGQRHFPADTAVSQDQAADQQQGKNSEDEKTVLNPGPAQRLRARTLELDAQGQSRKNIMQVTRDLRLPFSPPSRSGQQLVPMPKGQHTQARAV